VPVHIRVWPAIRLWELDSGAKLGDIYIYTSIYIIGQSPARDTPLMDEFDSVELEPSWTR
jgi:hypothetical protein